VSHRYTSHQCQYPHLSILETSMLPTRGLIFASDKSLYLTGTPRIDASILTHGNKKPVCCQRDTQFFTAMIHCISPAHLTLSARTITHRPKIRPSANERVDFHVPKSCFSPFTCRQNQGSIAPIFPLYTYPKHHKHV
jgi:hypothetical protein